MKKKDAPQPIINQRWEKVPTGRKHITTIIAGPHLIEAIAYPNHGYYVEVDGVVVALG